MRRSLIDAVRRLVGVPIVLDRVDAIGAHLSAIDQRLSDPINENAHSGGQARLGNVSYRIAALEQQLASLIDLNEKLDKEIKIASRIAHLDRTVDLVQLGDFLNMMFVDDLSYESVPSNSMHKSIHDQVRHLFPGPADATDPFSMAIKTFAQRFPDFTFCDIGAQYGTSAMTTVRLLRHIGTNPRVFAFEPGTASALTKINFDNNGFDDIEFIHAAVGPFDGWVVLHREVGYSADNRIVNPLRDAQRGSTSYPVRCCKLDTFLKCNAAFGPTVAKIDTQGAEPGVIAGMSELIASHPVTMLMEYTPDAISSAVDPVEFITNLQKTHSIFDVTLECAIENPAEHRARVENTTEKWTDLLLQPIGI